MQGLFCTLVIDIYYYYHSEFVAIYRYNSEADTNFLSCKYTLLTDILYCLYVKIVHDNLF